MNENNQSVCRPDNFNLCSRKIMTDAKIVSSHLRGLDLLVELNRNNYSTALDLSRRVNLPRSTVYRLLDTLIEAGMVIYDDQTNTYCLSQKVRSLSSGFDDRAHVIETARSFITEFSHKICWPSYLFIEDGDAVVPRVVVRSPRALAYPKRNKRFPFSLSSPGRIHLAKLPENEKESIVARELSTRLVNDKSVTEQKIERAIQDARILGCGLRDAGMVPRTCSIALPIHHKGTPAVYWTIVFIRSVLSVNKALDLYLVQAQDVVSNIEKSLA